MLTGGILYRRGVKQNTRAQKGLQEHLDGLVRTSNVARNLSADPIRFVHAATDMDREVVALIAASLAFGNVKMIGASITRCLAALSGQPRAFVMEASLAELNLALDGFVHRVYRGADVAVMLANVGAILRQHGTLGAWVAQLHHRSDGDITTTLAVFADALRGERASRGLQHLLPDARKGSACKRLLLLFRWMVRNDNVDFGLWKIPTRDLLIPVDTHVLRISRNLGLTTRNDASLKTSREITRALQTLDANDPVRYDFALCHLGISRDCPSKQVAQKCAACVVKPICTVWQIGRKKT